MYGYIYADLSQWIEVHAGRLHRVGKGDLADTFEGFTVAFFAGDDMQATRLLPQARELAHAMNEPLWGYVIAYYDALMTISWLGDLKTGLRRAMGAYSRASRDPRAELISLYLAEVIGFAWLDVDNIAYGYMTDYLSALKPTRPGFPQDVFTRLKLLHNYGYAALVPGDAANSIRWLVEELEDDWPQPYLDAVYGHTYAMQKSYDRAEAVLRKAISGFEAMNLRYEANETRATLGWMFRERDIQPKLRKLAKELIQHAEPLMNPVHKATGYAFMGDYWDRDQKPALALPYYLKTIALMKGLGWERLEALFAVNFHEMCAVWEIRSHWKESEQLAERLTTRLPSDDLYKIFASNCRIIPYYEEGEDPPY